MRKLASIALAFGLALLMCASAGAEGSAEIVRAFVYDGTLYTYISMDGVDRPITKAEAKLGGQSFAASGRLETVRQAGSPVTWLLLVDNSTSMPAFREEADDFARQLAQSGGENTRFILATFGDAFRVAGEDVPADRLAEEMERLPFDERVTRLHTAIGQALDYFENLPRERNELRCMVILSDAVQYDPAGGIPYDELLERVSRSDVMLHSVGLGGDKAALDRLGRLAEASGGLHQTAGERPMADIAGALAENGNGLFVTGFDLSGYPSEGGTEGVSVTFVSDGALICRAEAQVELPEQEGASKPQTLPDLPEAQGPPEGGTAPAPSGNPPAQRDREIPLLPIAVGGLVLILAAVIIWIRRK